jgi:hypothetical protein
MPGLRGSERDLFGSIGSGEKMSSELFHPAFFGDLNALDMSLLPMADVARIRSWVFFFNESGTDFIYSIMPGNQEWDGSLSGQQTAPLG